MRMPTKPRWVCGVPYDGRGCLDGGLCTDSHVSQAPAVGRRACRVLRARRVAPVNLTATLDLASSFALCNSPGFTPQVPPPQARVMWAEGVARAAAGDLSGFDTRVVAPVQRDLLERTWLHERYLCDGTPARSAYFFECAPRPHSA